MFGCAGGGLGKGNWLFGGCVIVVSGVEGEVFS